MRAQSVPSTVRPRAHRGVAMIDVLVGMLVIAFWLLTNAGLQAASLKFQKGAEYRLTAITLATELGERMEANPRAAAAGDYTLPETRSAVSSNADCSRNACTPSTLAQADLAQWSARAAGALRLNAISVASVPGDLTTYRITISWEEPRARQAYAGDPASTETMSYVTTKVIRNAT